MKRSILVVFIFSILFITACSTSEKYPYEHVGIYDTKTKQYIDIGDSKDKVDKILGPGTKDGNSYYDYDDILSMRFDDNDNVESIHIYFDWFPDEGENERYALADGTDYNTTITEFISKYKHVYEGAFILPDSAVSVILQNKNGKLILPDLDDIKKNSQNITTFQNEQNNDDIYVISIDYVAYDNLSSFDIEKIEYPSFENWDNFKKIES